MTRGGSQRSRCGAVNDRLQGILEDFETLAKPEQRGNGNRCAATSGKPEDRKEMDAVRTRPPVFETRSGLN
jgi:hypothetical protein